MEFFVNKAKSVLGFNERWAKELNEPYICNRLYIAFVRPSLEYSAYWASYYQYHIDRIEFVLFALLNLPLDPTRILPPYC